MSTTKLNKVYRYADAGWGPQDIAVIVSEPIEVVKTALRERSGVSVDSHTALRSEAKRMLQRVPFWWRGTAASYEACVRNNFADVL